jgi:hypothetical protein
MTAAELLAEARTAGVTLRLVDGKPVIKWPAVRPEALIASLKLHRDAILELLKAEALEDEQVAIEERAAVLEYDEGLPRPLAEQMDMDEVRSELKKWQEAGLAGTPRSDADKQRVASLWRRVDDDCRASTGYRGKTREPRS